MPWLYLFPGNTSRYLTEKWSAPAWKVSTCRVSPYAKNIRIFSVRKWLPATRYVSSMPASLPVQATTGKTPSVWTKAIVDNKVLETKAEQEAKFAALPKEKQNADYAAVVGKIDEYVEANILPLQLTYFLRNFQKRYQFLWLSRWKRDLATALQKNKKKMWKTIATLKRSLRRSTTRTMTTSRPQSG